MWGFQFIRLVGRALRFVLWLVGWDEGGEVISQFKDAESTPTPPCLRIFFRERNHVLLFCLCLPTFSSP